MTRTGLVFLSFLECQAPLWLSWEALHLPSRPPGPLESGATGVWRPNTAQLWGVGAGRRGGVAPGGGGGQGVGERAGQEVIVAFARGGFW